MKRRDEENWREADDDDYVVPSSFLAKDESSSSSYVDITRSGGNFRTERTEMMQREGMMLMVMVREVKNATVEQNYSPLFSNVQMRRRRRTLSTKWFLRLFSSRRKIPIEKLWRWCWWWWRRGPQADFSAKQQLKFLHWLTEGSPDEKRDDDDVVSWRC